MKVYREKISWKLRTAFEITAYGRIEKPTQTVLTKGQQEQINRFLAWADKIFDPENLTRARFMLVNSATHYTMTKLSLFVKIIKKGKYKNRISYSWQELKKALKNKKKDFARTQYGTCFEREVRYDQP